jgi:hypothetical protein
VRKLKRFWQFLSALSTLTWIASTGVGAVVSALLVSLLHLEPTLRVIVFVGTLMFTTAVFVPVAQWGIGNLAELLRPPPGSVTDDSERITGEVRAAIRAVQAELSENHDDLSTALEQMRWWRGYLGGAHWRGSRDQVGSLPRSGKAYRATEAAHRRINELNSRAREQLETYYDQTDTLVYPDPGFSDPMPIREAIEACVEANDELEKLLDD